MRARLAVLAVCSLFAVTAGVTAASPAQARRKPATRRAAPAPPPAPALRTEPAAMACPSVLGVGVRTKRAFCDVLTGREFADGVPITLPPHTGPVTLTFDLHNRHTYSEELTRAKRAYSRYTATIGVFTADNTLISRAIVQSEFRAATDLFDRVSGGSGPGGLKAVAPVGDEMVSITIPEGEDRVSLVGEKLSVVLPDGEDTFSAPGRPIALVSNVIVEYRPAPVKKPAAPRRR